MWLSLLGNKWVWIALALAGALGWGQIQTWRLHSSQKDVQAITAAFEGFKAQVDAEGKIAQQKADTQAAADKLKKEKADAENKRTHALDSQRIASLRHDLDNRSAYSLPASPPGASRADLACFDRAEFSRASGEALGRLRAIADQGDAATVDLNTAKAWALQP